MLLTDKFIERARAHARGKRRAIGALNFDIWVIPEKILHEGNYGAPMTQAIPPCVYPKEANFAPVVDWRTRLIASGMLASRS